MWFAKYEFIVCFWLVILYFLPLIVCCGVTGFNMFIRLILNSFNILIEFRLIEFFLIIFSFLLYIF